jgi:energy-coupling factor transport system ATP-binding protein
VSATAASQTLVEANGVHVWYQRGLPGERHALRGVTLRIGSGDRVGLLGASGAGKSTLLHLFAQLRSPNTGRVRVSDTTLPSLVFQFPERQLFAESVRDEVGYGLREAGLAPAEVESRVQAALDDVGLPPELFAARTPFHLSAGERRRVALAGALAQRRRLVLLDEPSLGLDGEGTARLVDILERLHAGGVAYWVASHDADFVASTCSRLVVLQSGVVVFDGEADDFWRQPEPAASYGVRRPRESVLADRLRACGAEGLPSRPSAEQLAEALLVLWHRRSTER